MKTASPSLKRFAAWATGLTDSYRHNLFVRSSVNIILLQVVVALITIAAFWWAIGYTQVRTVDTISGVEAVQAVPQAVDNVRNQTVSMAFFGLVVLTALFGYLLSSFALRPARDSLQFQKRFIGNVAHEIRTPLAIVKTNTEVALMDPTLPRATREHYESTIDELNRISETINNLLSFDNLIRPERLKVEPVDLGTIADTVASRHQALADSRGVKLIVTKGSHTYARGNATALEQVLTNLVKNAVNYTPQHKDGRVEIIVEPDHAGHVVATVSDTGIGIAQKDLYHIFEPFYRADTSRARGIGTGAAGLGLAIVNEIVRLHRGSISIKSVVGEGTTIKVSLPKAQPPLPEATA